MNVLLWGHCVNSTEEVTALATASTPELLDLRSLGLLNLGTRTGTIALTSIYLRERITGYNPLPCLWPTERVRFIFIEEEGHVLNSNQQAPV